MYSFDEFASEALLLDIVMISIIYATTLLFTFDFNLENFFSLFLIEDVVLNEENPNQVIVIDNEALGENNRLRHRHFSFFNPPSDPDTSIQPHSSPEFV